MDMTGIQQRLADCVWSEELQQLIAERDVAAADQIRRAREDYQSERFVLTVLGKAKRGKSTLVNALLGRHDDQLAPIDKLPASNALSRFVYATNPTTRVFFRPKDAFSAAVVQAISADRIREYVTEELNSGNHKQVEFVEVAQPFVGFDPHLVLIDTPGGGSIHDYHDELLHAVIPQSDAVLFLVTARMPLDQDELELLQQVRAADVRKIIFAINKIDQTSPADLEAASDHNAALLSRAGIEVQAMHAISALRAFEGNLAQSGLEPLLAEIGGLIQRGKSAILRQRFRSRTRELAAGIWRGLRAELELRGASAAEREQQRQALVASKNRLATERTAIERRFLARWAQAVDQFAAGLRHAAANVKSAVVDQITHTSLAGTGRLSKRLSSVINGALENELLAPSQTLELALQVATRDLEVEYPAIMLDPADPLAVHTSDGGKLVKHIGGAVATAATGAGIIAAANSAAAASFAVVTSPSLVGIALTALTGSSGGFLTSTTVPVAIPLWVAAAGPVGWTLAGLGTLTIPFAWAVNRSRTKESLHDQASQHVDRLFESLRSERIPELRRSAEGIVEEFRFQAERRVLDLEQALEASTAVPKTLDEQAQLERLSQRLQELLENEPGDRPHEAR